MGVRPGRAPPRRVDEADIAFRFGIAELREIVHVFLLARVEIDGERQAGVSADNLPPKWFTFADAVRRNELGIRLGSLHQELAGHEPRELVPRRPLARMTIRPP